MTTKNTSTIEEIYAEDPANISENKVLLVDPKKKKGPNRPYPTFNFLVRGIFERGGRVFVRGNHIPSDKRMVLDQRTRIFL